MAEPILIGGAEQDMRDTLKSNLRERMILDFLNISVINILLFLESQYGQDLVLPLKKKILSHWEKSVRSIFSFEQKNGVYAFFHRTIDRDFNDAFEDIQEMIRGMLNLADKEGPI